MKWSSTAYESLTPIASTAMNPKEIAADTHRVRYVVVVTFHNSPRKPMKNRMGGRAYSMISPIEIESLHDRIVKYCTIRRESLLEQEGDYAPADNGRKNSTEHDQVGERAPVGHRVLLKMCLKGHNPGRKYEIGCMKLEISYGS